MNARLFCGLVLFAALAVHAADPVKRPDGAPAKTMDLRSFTTSVEGNINWRVTKKDLEIMTANAPAGPRPFQRGEPFLRLIPSPDDVPTFSPSPCASEPGINCIPKFTGIGWVCKCQGLPGTPEPGKGDGGGAVERCRLALSQPVSEGISRLQCVSLTPCVGCCKFVRVSEAGRPMFGCQCQ